MHPIEQLPDGWSQDMCRLLERFEEPAAQTVWRPWIEDLPYCFAVVAKPAVDQDGQDILRANVIQTWEQFPPGLWMVRGVEYMLEKLAMVLGKQRGAGDESLTPVDDDSLESRVVGMGLVMLTKYSDGPADDVFPTLYCTDVAENFYVRKRLCEPASVTEWGRLENQPDDDETYEAFWSRQHAEHPALCPLHVHLGRLAWTCIMSPEEAAETYGEPVAFPDDADEMFASYSEYIHGVINGQHPHVRDN